jgi:hypothetical protein
MLHVSAHLASSSCILGPNALSSHSSGFTSCDTTTVVAMTSIAIRAVIAIGSPTITVVSSTATV